jgi:hypothetical protein
MSICSYNPKPTRVWSRVQSACTYIDPELTDQYTVYIPLTGQTVSQAQATYQDKQIYKGNILQHKGNSARLTKSQKYSQLARCTGPNRTKVFATQSETYTNPNTTGLLRTGFQSYPYPNQIVGAPNNISGPFQYNVANPNDCSSNTIQDGGTLVCGTYANPCTGEIYIKSDINAEICNPASASDVPGSEYLCWNKNIQTWFPRQRYSMNNSGDKWPINYKEFVSGVDRKFHPPPSISFTYIVDGFIILKWNHLDIFTMDSFNVYVNGIFIKTIVNTGAYTYYLSIQEVEDILNNINEQNDLEISTKNFRPLDFTNNFRPLDFTNNSSYTINFTAVTNGVESDLSNTIVLSMPDSDNDGGGNDSGGGGDSVITDCCDTIDKKLKQISADILSIKNDISNNMIMLQNDINNNTSILQNNINSNTSILRNDISNNTLILRNDISNNTLILRNDISNNTLIIRNDISNNNLLIRNDISNNILLIRNDISNNTFSIKNDISNNTLLIRNDISNNTLSIKNDISNNTLLIRNDISNNTLLIRNDISNNTLSIKNDISDNTLLIRNDISDNTLLIRNDISYNTLLIRNDISDNTLLIRNDISDNTLLIRNDISNNIAILKNDIIDNMVSIKNEIITTTLNELNSINSILLDIVSTSSTILDKIISLKSCCCDTSCNCDFYNSLFANSTITQINSYVMTYISTAYEDTDIFIPIDEFDTLNISLENLKLLFVTNGDEEECCFSNIIDIYRNMLKIVKYAFDNKIEKQTALINAESWRQDSITLRDSEKLKEYLEMLTKSFRILDLTITAPKATLKPQYTRYHELYGIPPNLDYDPQLMKQIFDELDISY